MYQGGYEITPSILTTMDKVYLMRNVVAKVVIKEVSSFIGRELLKKGKI